MRLAPVVVVASLVVGMFPSVAAAQAPSMTFASLARRPEVRAGKDVMITFSLIENSAPQRFHAEVVSIDSTAIRVQIDGDFNARRTDLYVEVVDRSDSPIFAEPAHTVIEIPVGRVARITTIDPLGNGALIGAGSGAAPVALACIGGCDGTIAGIGIAVGAGVGLAIGALADAAHAAEGRTLYEAPGTASAATFRFAPVVSRERKGALFIINW
jgi:hypothetical protein